MYDRADLHLIKQDSESTPHNPPCPHCGYEITALNVVMSERKLRRHQRTFTCLRCQKEFKLNPMADDPNIPF